VLRPGGRVGFSDLALRNLVSPGDDRELRAVLYHSAADLVTDWPVLFERGGFEVVESRDIIAETLPTWEHARAVYRGRHAEVLRRYGQRLADKTVAHLERIACILAEHGTFPALAAQKPKPA
jgi:hypothetical protein